mmetsp:Transcript_78311/g.141308  ORF Transcript_78311/g.141308 Transcript_78311/m.141308 type:complete len:326 (-) Transcript_78311:943-1920(-)
MGCTIAPSPIAEDCRRPSSTKASARSVRADKSSATEANSVIGACRARSSSKRGPRSARPCPDEEPAPVHSESRTSVIRELNAASADSAAPWRPDPPPSAWRAKATARPTTDDEATEEPPHPAPAPARHSGSGGPSSITAFASSKRSAVEPPTDRSAVNSCRSSQICPDRRACMAWVVNGMHSAGTASGSCCVAEMLQATRQSRARLAPDRAPLATSAVDAPRGPRAAIVRAVWAHSSRDSNVLRAASAAASFATPPPLADKDTVEPERRRSVRQSSGAAEPALFESQAQSVRSQASLTSLLASCKPRNTRSTGSSGACCSLDWAL